MELVSTPTLYCAECGEQIDDTGYLPAVERDDGYEPLADDAVCEACGFSEVGLMGCAPELDDLVDPDPGETLLYVRPTDDGIDVISAKD